MTHYNTQKPIIQSSLKLVTLTNAYGPGLRSSIWRPYCLFKVPPLDVNYGAPGSLRSFGLACLAIWFARLYPRLPFKLNEISPGPVVSQRLAALIDFDSGKRRTYERVTAFGKILHVPDDTPRFYLMLASWVDKGKISRVRALSETIKMHKCKRITTDNLGICSGRNDDNIVIFLLIGFVVRRIPMTSLKHNEFLPRDASSLGFQRSNWRQLNMDQLVSEKQGVFALTDIGNADRFVDRYGKVLNIVTSGKNGWFGMDGDGSSR